jgi:type I restriction enzyme S subunit
MNETLEATARAIFKSWFIDFDPVRARRGALPRAQVDLPDDVLALFPDSFEDSELGEVPKGWRVGVISDVADNIRDGVDPFTVDATTPYVGLEHVPQRKGWLDAWGAASEVESGKARFCSGDILFGKLRPYFHKVALSHLNGICSTDILVVRPQDTAWRGFAFGHLFSDQMVTHATTVSDGTKMPRTSWDALCRFPIAIPDAVVAQTFQTVVEKSYEYIAGNIHESRTLAALRDALLPKLLSGEIRVDDDDGRGTLQRAPTDDPQT